MIRWQAFTAVCAHLRAGLLGGAPPGPAAPVPWELMIEVSSYHFVTTALAWCLRDAALPADIRGYFDAALMLNAERNEHILSELECIVRALNAIDIEPVLLKGAAHLVGGLYPTPGLRILGDLDLLVPTARAGAADAALKRIGFVPISAPAWIETDAHHLPRLHHGDKVAAVELHTRVADEAGECEIIPVPWFCAGTRAFSFRGARLHLPDATRSIAHTIVHDQIHHGGYRRNTAELRQLLDVAMTRARADSAIEWRELEARFADARPVLSTYLTYGQGLFAQPMPNLGGDCPSAAMARLQRTVERPVRWAKLAELSASYAARLRAKPLCVLNLFNMRTWPDRIRVIAAALKSPKW